MWANTPCAQPVTDGVLKYDTIVHRWIVTRVGVGPADNLRLQCIAVSEGEDPTGAWFRYAFPLSIPGINGIGDFPKISVWSNSYTFTALARTTPGITAESEQLGNYIVAFERDAMLAGKPASAVEFLAQQTPSPSVAFHFLAASNEGAYTFPAPSPVPFVQRFIQSDQLAVWNLNVNWKAPSKAIFSLANLVPVIPYAPIARNIPQPPINGSPSQQLESIQVLSQPFIYLSAIISPFSEISPCPPQPPQGVKSGYSGSSCAIPAPDGSTYQQAVYAPADGNDRWLASIGVDQLGNMGMMFNVSGPATFPFLHYAKRSIFDQPGTLRTEASLVEGGGSQVLISGACGQDTNGNAVCPFGDYSQSSTDPIDGCTMWMSGEYYPDQTQGNVGNFSTRVGAIRLPLCQFNER